MDADIKAKLEELGTTIVQFKAANEEEIKQIKAKGTADPLTTEQVAKANAAIDAVKAELKELQARTDDVETKANRPGLGGDGGKKSDDLRASAKLFFNAISEGKTYDLSADQIKEYEAYKDSFAKHLRHSPDSRVMQSEGVRASLSVGSNPDGGFWTPTEMLNTIVTRVFETSPMRQVSDVITTSMADVEFPKDVNSGTSGGWTSETGSIAATATPGIGMQKIVTHEQFAMPEVTQKFLDDAAIDVETWLSGKIADIISRTENTGFVTGNGVGKPRGFLDYGAAATTTDDATRNWGLLQYVASGASAGFPLISGLVADDSNCLITCVHKVKQIYRQNAQWLMNRNTIGSIRKLRDAHGRYLWQDSLLLGQPDKLLSYPVTEAQDMPDLAANSLSIAFGNFKLGYRIVDRTGLRVLRDPFTNKPFVRFYSTKRVGGDVVNFDAIKLIKMAAS